MEDEAAGIGDGHEVADDVRVGDGDGATLVNLLFKMGNNGAVAAKHIAKAGGNELRVPLSIEALDVHLGESLGRAHVVAGVDSLVGGDHDEFLDLAEQGVFRYVDAAPDIGADAFAGVGFHHGDVLVGGRVEDNAGAEVRDEATYSLIIADIANFVFDGCVGVGFLKLKSDVVHCCLRTVNEDELPSTELGSLAGYLAAYGACGSSDHDGLSADFAFDGLAVDFNFFAVLSVAVNSRAADVVANFGVVSREEPDDNIF